MIGAQAVLSHKQKRSPAEMVGERSFCMRWDGTKRNGLGEPPAAGDGIHADVLAVGGAERRKQGGEIGDVGVAVADEEDVYGGGSFLCENELVGIKFFYGCCTAIA